MPIAQHVARGVAMQQLGRVRKSISRTDLAFFLSILTVKRKSKKKNLALQKLTRVIQLYIVRFVILPVFPNFLFRFTYHYANFKQTLTLFLGLSFHY